MQRQVNVVVGGIIELLIMLVRWTRLEVVGLVVGDLVIDRRIVVDRTVDGVVDRLLLRLRLLSWTRS